MNKMFLFLFLFLLTACTSLNNEQGQQPFEDGDGNILDHKTDTPKTVSFREGEMTDITDRNPNFLDLNTENENHNNHGFFQNKLREVVNASDVFRPGMIYTNGGHMIVNVTPTKQLSDDELSKHKKQLKNNLMNAVPKYDIDLKVNNNQ